MKVYCVIQTYHHANWAFGCHKGILGLLYGVQGSLLLCRESVMILWKQSVVVNMMPTAETVNSRHRANKPTVGHVSER